MMQTRFVATQVHGRYLVEPAVRPASAPLVVGFHGYGESAEQHLDALRQLPGSRDLTLVAVQSLHLFYTRNRDVVGSWMTRQGREHAIPDNVAYAARVVGAVREELEAGGPLVYLGFSQGTSMAYRAAALSGHAGRALIALGGDLPPELAADPSLRLPPVLVARGTRDEWFTQQKLDNDLTALAHRGVPARCLVFDGGHEWTPEFYTAAGAFLRELTGEA